MPVIYVFRHTFSIMQILNQIQQDFDRYLIGCPFEDKPVSLYDPVNYVLNIGGKRLRPAVLLMGCYLFDGNYQKAMPAAFAIEVFHNFTLVHDDIMDKAPLRRGRSTVHEKYGLNKAILSGDVMMVQAFDRLLDLEDQGTVPAIMRVFTKLAIEVCEGQQMDMDFENQSSVEINAYLKMIELKTSVLVAGALKIGAIIGGAPDCDAEALYGFGRNLGIAFQLQDDLLDTYGDPEKFGKKLGGDISQNKKTFLYLKAFEMANEQDRRLLEGLYGTSPRNGKGKINQVIQVFDKLEIKKHTEAAKEKYWEEALRQLDKINAKPERKKVLEDFAQALMSREV